MVNDLVVEARGIAAEITDLRHLLHQHPEAGMQLPLTQQTVLDALAGLPLEVPTGTSCTSVTAVLRGGAAPERIEDRVVVLLRADMDGLPVQEETGMPFASQRDGFMHACGHDIHTATLVGAARLLCAHQSELAGDVVFMFQPGEELLQGARAMIAEGVLDAAGKRADAAYGMHVFSSVFPAGEFATRPGTLMAASDTMFVDIIGKGGHGSTPYLANDPVPVMAEVILGLQTLTAKKFSQFDPVVINVGVARAGDAANIIPESCHLEASIRTFSMANREKVERIVQDLVRSVCEAHGARAEITWRSGVFPLVCHPVETEFVDEQIRSIVGVARHRTMTEPLGGSEDFSEVLALVPGSFVCYSGVAPGRDLSETTFNHSSTAWFDDSIIPEATALYARIAMERIAVNTTAALATNR